MRRLPPLSAVRAFEAAARLLSYTRAGEELGMTQAAVSYQIKLLEERLGLKLFRREGRQVVLTEAGRKASPLVTNGFDTIEEAFRQLRAEDEGLLSITSSNTLAAKWLAPRIGAFQLANPDLAIRLAVSDQIVDLTRDGYDVGFRGGRGDWPGVESDFLMRVHYLPLASPDFAARHSVRDPADLLGLPLISPQDMWWCDWFESVGILPADRPAARGIRLDGQVFDAAAAIAGQGVAILVPALWRDEIERGQLVPLLDHAHIEPGAYWLARPEGRPGRKVRLFRDWVRAGFDALRRIEPAAVFEPPAAAATTGGTEAQA